MNFAQFKLSRMKRYGGSGYHSVKLELTNLALDGKAYVADGEAYTCKLVATNGKYLPTVIDIIGTTSLYAFKYDYTTGEIYIPSGEIFNDITIIAEASEIETNVPVVLTVVPTTANTYDGVTEYTDETFVAITVYPSRGSKVSVTYGGITKEVTNDAPTDNYYSPTGIDVYFGIYHGHSDGAIITDVGNLVISGAYEAWGSGRYRYKGKVEVGNLPNHLYCGNILNFDKLGSMIYIPYNAFHSCDKISNVIIPDNVLEIRGSAFQNCESLTSVVFSKNLISIGNSAFSGCTNLNLKTLPDKITRIESSTFLNCKNLELTSLPSGITSIGMSAFGSCYKLALTSLPMGVTFIETTAFSNCYKLALTSLPLGITSIEDSAFENCFSLENLLLHEGITNIGSNAFRMDTDIQAPALKNITLPSTLATLGSNAFTCMTEGSLYHMPYLTTVIILATIPPQLPEDSSAFGITNPSATKIIVPKGCLDAYSAVKGWSQYVSVGQLVEAE